MTKEEFDNLLRVRILTKDKWYTSPARLIDFISYEDGIFGVVYNEESKRFQKCTLGELTVYENDDLSEKSKNDKKQAKSEEREYYGGC